VAFLLRRGRKGTYHCGCILARNKIAMSKYPKLKVKKDAWRNSFEIEEFETAKYFPFGMETIIAVEGQQITSYEELLKLVEQDRFKRKRFLEVLFLPMISGG
jgi:hypothetical protein